jgi:hypothetical protein
MIATHLENVLVTVRAVQIRVKSMEREHAVLMRERHTATQFDDKKQQLPTIVVGNSDDTSVVEESTRSANHQPAHSDDPGGVRTCFGEGVPCMETRSMTGSGIFL